MAVALYEAGVFTWPQFQAALIARIARWEAAPAESAHWNYYQHWLGALEDVLADVAPCCPTTSPREPTTWPQRPTGHDHPYGSRHFRVRRSEGATGCLRLAAVVAWSSDII